MNRLLRIVCAAVLTACVLVGAPASRARPEGAASWVGKSILPKKPGVKIAATAAEDGKDVATLTDLICAVEEEKGDFLRVRHRDATGWLPKKDAVLLDEAVAFFTAAVRKDGKDAHAHGCRGLARGALGDYDSAIKDLGEAIHLQPTNPTWYLIRASAWEHRQQPDKALADLDLVIRLDPTEAVAFYNRGNLRLDRKEHDKALADFDQAIRLQPQFTQALCNRGIAWAARKEYDKALADLDRAIELNPQSAHGFYNRGRVWSEKREHDRALADFNEAIRLDPRYPPAFVCRGYVWTSKQEYDKALADFDEALRLTPKDTLVLGSRAYVHYLRKDHVKALANLDRAVEIEPAYTSGFYLRGKIRQDRKEYGLALADFDRALRLDPQDAGALNTQAWLLATCPDAKYRDGKRAVAAARRACDLTDYKNPYCLGTLAAACAEAGDFEQAVKNQKQALEDAEYARAEGDRARRRLELYEARKPCREE
jgi:tetratricopeptide (TPR) repeat protein